MRHLGLVTAVAGVAALGTAGSALAVPPGGQNGQSGTTLSTTVTAKVDWTRTPPTWDISKSVSDPSVELFRGDSKTVDYTVGVTKHPGAATATLSGKVCVSNGGGVSTQGLAISIDVDKPPSTVLKHVTLDVSAKPVIAAGGSYCYPYSTSLDPATFPAGSYKVVSHTTITNHSGHLNTAFGPNTAADFTMPAAPAAPDGSVHVTDTNGMSWTFGTTGSVTYSKTFSCDADAGLHSNTATIDETGQSASASVTVTCDALQVTKTARTSLDRTYSWTIAKAADTQGISGLQAGATSPINWTVTANATSADTNHRVAGDIIVHNGTALDATLAGVSDVMTGIDPSVPVQCGVEFPYTLAAGKDLACTYSTAVPDATSRVNTATATLVNHDNLAGDLALAVLKTTTFSGTAGVDFANATVNQIDETAAVSDTLKGSLGSATAGVDALPKVFTYTTGAGPLACGTNATVDNTASFVTNDTAKTGSASASVPVSAAACVPPVNPQPTPTPTAVVTPPVVVANTGTPAVRRGRLAVRKTGPKAAVAGQLVTYTITVRNTGRAKASRVVLKDVLPGGYTLARAVKGASLARGALAWKVGTLRAGASRTVRASFRIDRSVNGVRCNIATASATGLAGARARACTRIAAVAGAAAPAVTG